MSRRNLFLLCVVAVLFLVATVIPIKSNPDPITALIAGRNVNMVSGTELPDGDPYLQRQNEPSIAVSTRNPLHLLAGANDYRSIDIAMEDKLPGYEHTNQAPAPDAWLGVFKSIDGGSTWKSTLLPGFSYFDTTPEGAPPSPLFGFSAAADPVVRAGPNGLFFYAGIAFNREDRGDSAVFVSRFIDNNNKENVDTTAYIDTQILARGNSGQFIDKPWIAVDVPYPEPPSIPIDLPYLQDPYTDLQYVTRCNVYLAYSVFLGNPNKTPRTKIYFVRSTDSGMTWDQPTKLTETQHINQGAAIAIDPRGNGHVWVVWRRFAHMNKNGKIIQPDAIVVAKSEDGGRTFTRPIVVKELAPWSPPSDEGVFDQATTYESFRTNDYPTIAVDHNGIAYIAWAQRGFGPDMNPGTGVGEARIVMTASNDVIHWSTPEQIINYEEGDPPGHQFMPQLTYAAGKLTLLWYDQRWDVIQEYLPFIEDIYTNVRHTIDVRVAQAEIHSYPEFSNSIQVSKYPFLLWPSEEPGYFNALQLLYNKPNLPIFAHGTVPFMGDYIGITPSPMLLPPEDPNNPTDYWIYNTNPMTPTHYHAVWTDNRDVIPPGEDNWLGAWDQYNAPGAGCGEEDLTGVRNQNIYTSRISEGILAGSPGNTKPLNILRSFVVFVQNTTGVEKFFTLQIEKPDDMVAYFWQEGGGQPENIFVSVPPYSYLSKTILVGQYTPDEYASIIIKIYDDDTGALVSYVTLNPDSTNPWLDQPEGVDPDNPHARNEGETHTPHARNYSIIDWNYELQDPYINTIHPQFDEAIANNDGVTPYPVDGTGKNPHARNPHARNPHARNPHARNNVLNPHARNENIPSDIPEDSHMTDVVWTIENAGNTTTSYSINTFETPEDLPDGILAQLIVFKTYTTPTVDPYGDEDPNSEGTNGCELIEQEHQELIVMKTPHARNLSELGDISVLVPPKETFHVLYRFYNPYQEPEQKEFYDEEQYEEAVPDIESDVPDTDPDDPTQPLPEPSKPLVIPPQVLPDGVVGDTSYSTAIQVVGGTGTYGNWTIIDGALPGNLSLDSSSGVISGDLLTAIAGNYTFKVEVNDLDEEGYPEQTATKILSIQVVDPLEITTSSLPDSVLGVPYYAKLEATGGLTPYTWSLELAPPYNLPAGLSLDPSTGEITGTPTGIAPYPLNFKVTDSTNPNQSDTKKLIIKVVDPLVITKTTLYDAFRNGSYVDTLQATGGTETYTWSVISGTLPDGLALTPGTNRIEGFVSSSASTSTFTVQVTDSGSPIQTATQEITIDVYDVPTITTSSPLPGGNTGISYSVTLSGSGGNTPYEWSVFSGALPDGLSLNTNTGEISGTPTAGGTYNFEIRLTDSSNPQQIFNKDFTISINTMITGTLMYNGQPLTNYTTTENVEFRARKGGSSYPITPEYDNTTGEYSIPDITPGINYQINVYVDAAPPYEGESYHPGDYSDATDLFDVSEGDNVINIDFNLRFRMRLLAPFDNSTSYGLVPPPGPYRTHSSPIGFQWESIPEASSYGLYVQKSTGGMAVPWMTTSNTWVNLTLPESGPDDYYRLALVARNATGDIIADTWTVYDNGYGTVYPFKAIPGFKVTTASLYDAFRNGGYVDILDANYGIEPYNWSIISGSLPDGLALTAGTNRIEGTVSGTATTSTFTVQVTDSGSPSQAVTKELTIYVYDPPTITTSSLPDGTVETSYSETLSGSGGNTPYTWSLYSGSLPPELSLNTSTGEISGTPTTEGTYNFEIRLTDSSNPSQTAAANLSITISPSTRTISGTIMMPGWDPEPDVPVRNVVLNGLPGNPVTDNDGNYSATVTYGWSGTVTPTKSGYLFYRSSISYSNVTDNLTDQNYEGYLTISGTVTYNSSGLEGVAFSGFPATPFPAPVTDSNGFYAGAIPYLWRGTITPSKTGYVFSPPQLPFYEPTTPEVEDFTAARELQITTSSLPDGVKNQSYSATLSATGGTTPYSWSISDGTLPSGLNLNSSTGAISGEPSVDPGVYVFTVRVDDSGSGFLQQHDTKTLTIKVNDPLQITTSSPLPNAKVGVYYSYTLNATGGNGTYVWEWFTTAIPGGQKLPPGLSLNSTTGVISGYPSQNVLCMFYIRVRDTASPQQITSQYFMLGIDAVPEESLQINPRSLSEENKNHQ